MRWLILLLAVAGCGGNSTSPNLDGGGCFAGQEMFQGVCLTPPTVAAARTSCQDVTEYCATDTTMSPSLSCLSPPFPTHATMPDHVTLTGFVHPFSSGTSNSAVTIQIFRATDLLAGADPKTATTVVPQTVVTFDPSTATDPNSFRACDIDPMVGCVATTPSACQTPVCLDGLSGRMDQKMYCNTVNGTPTCSQRLRWEPRFSIDNVPTNTPLAIRTSGKNGEADETWAVLVAFNIFLGADDKSCGGNAQATDCTELSDASHPKYQLNVNVLSQSDYVNIPEVAGLSSGISTGLGAIAGEVHDCDNVRLGDVQVGTAPAGDRLTYFNGNPYHTLPDGSRAQTGTDRLGLYASLNIPPGKVSIEAAGLVGSSVASVGGYQAMVYPNTVSVVNLNSGKPPQ